MNQRRQEQIKKNINQIIKNYKPEKIYLFGFFVWGRPKPSNDINLIKIGL